MLEVENLKTQFRTEGGVVRAVDGLSFTVSENDKVAIVGESGAGKSVTGLSILRLIGQNGWISNDTRIEWKGEELTDKTEEELDNMRGKEISWIPQNPLNALNPTTTIGKQIRETMVTHQIMSKQNAHERAIELLKEVGISGAEERFNDYPHEFSGGMRQRVLIAIAISCNPDLIIADEPTTALDVIIQAKIIGVINELIDDYNTALLLITHDLGVVAELCHRALVMYAGEIIEKSKTESLFDNPLHPYTIALMACNPSISSEAELNTIPGEVPTGEDYPTGCRFHPRCPEAMDHCSEVHPELREQNAFQETACLLYKEDD